MDVLWTILIFGGLLALMIFGFVEKSKEKAKSQDALAKFTKDIKPRGFNTRFYKSDTIFVAIDSTSNQLAYAAAPRFETTIVSASKIMSVEVFEDERSVTHAHRGRQIGAAILGNALAGSTGAIIGGLGAKAKSTDMVNRIILRIEVDDPSRPLLDVGFLKTPTKRGGYVHDQTSREARTWSSLVTGMMRKSEEAEPVAPVAPPLNQLADSKLENLTKLSDLRERGVLTPDEFEREKARILNRED